MHDKMAQQTSKKDTSEKDILERVKEVLGK
ncbi:Uncharacterised protein [Staphylococcus microti]|uniref:Uncharacterized protein n=1 Tax=Staphylococcus microti TaxID=569857 RepID=A0A380GRI6_9STAP|nr:Uncharacterised protein [Staphylococcus microti]